MQGEGGILPVCGARHLSSGNKSPCYLSTAKQLCALASSSTGRARTRFPLAGTRRSDSNPFQFQATKKRLPTKVNNRFFLAEKEGSVPYTQFSPIPYYTWV